MSSFSFRGAAVLNRNVCICRPDGIWSADDSQVRRGVMDFKSGAAAGMVALIVELLTEESGVIWKREKVATVWLLAPVSSEPLVPGVDRGSPQKRLRMSPVESESTAEPFEIHIFHFCLTERFLLYVAGVLYEQFGLLTEVELESAEEVNCPEPLTCFKFRFVSSPPGARDHQKSLSTRRFNQNNTAA